MKRRDFLKVGAAASTGLLLPGCRPIPRVETLPVAEDLGKKPRLPFLVFYKAENYDMNIMGGMFVTPKLVLDYPYATTERPRLPVALMSFEDQAIDRITGRDWLTQCLNKDEIFAATGRKWFNITSKGCPYLRMRTADTWLCLGDAHKETTYKHGFVNGQYILTHTYSRRFWGWVEVWERETREHTFQTWLVPYQWKRKSNLIYDKIVNHV